MKVSLVLQAYDRISGPARNALASTRQLGNGIRSTGAVAAPASRALERVHSATGRLPAAFSRAAGAARSLAGTRGLALVEAASKRTDAAIGGLARRAAGLAKFGAGAAVAGGLGITAMLTRGMLTTGMEFEGYRVRLESSLHSAEAAKKAMEVISKFAADTPYEIGQVMDAFIAAKNNGIDPFNGAMIDIGDKASAMGADFTETVKAVADGTRFQWERLLDLGVVGSTKGAMVSFTYADKDGKQAVRTVKKDAIAVRTALLSIFREQNGGGMAMLSRAMSGIVANLHDQWTRFLLRIADAGIYAKVKRRLQDVLAWADRMNANGQLDVWAKRASRYMEELFDRADRFVHDVDWNAVVNGVAGVTSAIVHLVEWIGKAEKAWGKINQLGDWADRKAGTDNGSKSLESRAWSLMTWDPFDAWAYGNGGGGKGSARPQPRSLPAPRALPPPRTGLVPRQSHTPAAQKVSLDINLRGEGAARAQVGRVRAPGAVDVAVSRGRAMSGVG